MYSKDDMFPILPRDFMDISLGKMRKIMNNYPATVKENMCGKCLIATRDIEEGVIVTRFDGVRIKYKQGEMKPTPDEISEEDLNHFLIIDEENLVIPRTTARYMNHSCDPNCDVNDDMDVVTIRPVKNGEELTISYNIIDKKWKDALWDSRWNFKCFCNSRKCQGVINKYVYQEGDKWVQVGKIWTLNEQKSNPS